MKQFSPPSRVRLGISLVEVTLALTLLAAIGVAVAQVASLAVAQQQREMRNAIALIELENMAEYIATLPFELVTEAEIAEYELSPAAMDHLPQLTFQSDVAEEAEPAARRVLLSLGWQNNANRSTAPLQLAVWRFSEGE